MSLIVVSFCVRCLSTSFVYGFYVQPCVRFCVRFLCTSFMYGFCARFLCTSFYVRFLCTCFVYGICVRLYYFTFNMLAQILQIILNVCWIWIVSYSTCVHSVFQSFVTVDFPQSLDTVFCIRHHQSLEAGTLRMCTYTVSTPCDQRAGKECMHILSAAQVERHIRFPLVD